MDYTIKQKNNQLSYPPDVYDEGISCVYIAKQGGKFGVITDDEQLLVPFEYDNISMGGFCLYQLIRGGKMGLAHIEGPGSESPFFCVKTIIPCEYDFIEFPKHGSSFAILRKDEEISSTVQIYFCTTGELSRQFYKEKYSDRKYIVVTDDKNGTVDHVLYKDGRELFSTTERDETYGIVNVYETERGTVFLNLGYGECWAELILLKKRRMARFENLCSLDECHYEPTGEIKRFFCREFYAPVALGHSFFGDERKSVKAFVVETEDGCLVIDGALNPICQQEISDLTICTQLEGKLDDVWPITINICAAKLDDEGYYFL